MKRSHRRQAKSMQWLKANLPKLLIVLLGTTVLAGGLYMVTRKSPDDHLRSGIALQEKGDLKGASIELKNALQAMPDNGEARFRLGQVLFSQGDYLGAEKEFKKSRELGLRDPSLDVFHARTLLQLGEFRRLLSEIQIQDGIEPDARAALLALRARAQFLFKDGVNSQRSLSEADAIVPEHPESLFTRAVAAFSEKDTDGALAFMDKALAKASGRADFWLLKGDLLRITKKNDLAMQAYTKALESEPANVPARLSRAQLHLESSDLDKASADLKEVRKQAPNDVMGRYLEAYIEFRRGRHTESNNILQGILRGSPGFLPGHMLAGTVNIALGNREAARAHLDKVLAAAPNHALARKLMAATMADLGDLGQAKALLASFGNAADDPLLSTLQGKISLRQGDYAEARKHLEQIPEGTRQDAKYFTDLAASRLGSGDEAGAVAALSRAAELDTESQRPEVLLVVTHLKAKQYAEALKVVDKLGKERPQDPLPHNLRGAIHMSQQDVGKARSSFNKALEVRPDYFPAASNLALLDIRANDPKSARARYQQLLKHNQKESRAWLALAALDARDRNDAGHLQNLEEAKKANDKAPEPRVMLVRYWLGKKDAGKALVEARSALDATGRTAFTEYIGLAQASQGDHTNALATFSKWAESNPANPVAHFRVAQEQAATKDLASALKSLDKALALRPDFVEADLNKALILGQTGRSEDGVKIARKLQARLPKAAAGYLAEAELLNGEKRYLDAARQFARAAQLSGKGQTLMLAHQAYLKGGQGVEGEKLLSQWLLANPKDTTVRHHLALSQLNARRLKDAADNYRILAQASPKDLVAHNNLAWILGELGDKEAVSVAEQTLKLDPDNPATLDTVGWVQVNAGNTKRGLDLLQQAHAKAPTAPEIHWHLAMALAKSGDRQRAKEELEKLIYSGLDFPQKAQAKKYLENL